MHPTRQVLTTEMASEDEFELDEEHPIPNLDVFDVRATYKAGGSIMTIVVASPLQDDARSLRRLMCKFDRYLAYAWSEEGIAECGEPTIENTTIEVLIHPGSAPAVFELIERCAPWLAAKGVKLVVDTKGVVGVAHS